MKQHGPWQIESSEQKFYHRRLAVFEEQIVRRDGSRGTYAVARIPAGASVLALDETGCVYLTREFRYALGAESVEVVSGALDEGETALAAAQRELREELGIEAAEFIPLGRVDPLTSQLDSPAHLFLARQLRFGPPALDRGEVIAAVKLPLPEAVAQALRGDITHGTTCVLLWRAQHFLQHERTA